MSFYSIGQSFIESKMIDECIIYRDKPGVQDDVLNVATGELEAPEGDRETLYDGVCIIKPVSTRDMYYDEASETVYRKVYDVLLPKSATKVELGDILYVESSVHDANLVGREFRFMEYRHSTHSTYRGLRIEDIQQDYSGTNPSS